MNSKDMALVSSATLIGAVTSAIVVLFFTNRKKQFNGKDSGSNNIIPEKISRNDPFDPSKRRGYLSWDDYFMAIAFLSAQRSKDPNRQVKSLSDMRILLPKNRFSVLSLGLFSLSLRF
ncbi:hypothetical protein Nepgr_018572 [Nepenthes gracilis]|uniref:Uncharacterized protein n=1 Tax=Nepenthes gracilis TaxID=150966 RepID=A0AAD3SVC7_NEPGR|nr:hypothetical protein Nepgr_018572 [Nepenthes gracilis]